MFGYNNLLREAEFDDLLYANIQLPSHRSEEDFEEQSLDSAASSFVDDFPTQAEVDSERPVEELTNSPYFV
ncbi:hypothetical protein TVAG_155080 [Trichomonas vaginalis G3]|uniref:Uncharacterized protein n=1 Tax=Trichomonas vaginalis (strain ATCC PRA-98 / G3) TaxID=412133 RepID=A2FY13_TRIV3|nr:hypothetical protein TVAGG3_1025600 [Trichomonas vaginalis G3]EAX90212.1 hypothetical protein TVAG_155080 [Trichomonas vaginalis G3]KAI5492475.1 hypothetical protein TVAGG3_1025600 [Trichomonas vaginalis G3]|eukprot:XP_001303142.1 hypothetical protein [Trichomonas vaginalis G3]